MSLADLLATAPDPKVAPRETADEAADRLDVSAEDAEALRVSLGTPFRELASVDLENEHGPVVTTNDGTRMIFIGGENVDVPGWRLYGRPDGRPVNDPDAPPTPIPVFVDPPKPADEDADEDEPKPAAKKAPAKPAAGTDG